MGSVSLIPEAWGGDGGGGGGSLSFTFRYHSSASLLIQAASAGQGIRISKHWLGIDSYVQGDGIMLCWVVCNWLYGWLDVCMRLWVLKHTHTSTCFTPRSFDVCACIFSACQYLSAQVYLFLWLLLFYLPQNVSPFLFIPVCDVSPDQNLFIFMFPAQLSLLHSAPLAALPDKAAFQADLCPARAPVHSSSAFFRHAFIFPCLRHPPILPSPSLSFLTPPIAPPAPFKGRIIALSPVL